MNILRIREGDIIVLKLKEEVSDDVATVCGKNVKDLVKEATGLDVGVLLLGEGTDISVLRVEPEDDEKQLFDARTGIKRME